MNDPARTAEFRRWQLRALIIGVSATALSLIGAFINRPQFFHSYLFAWIYWSGLSLGSLILLMLQFLTGGEWGRALRSLTSAGSATISLMALLFLPIIFGLTEIYPWARGFFGEGEHAHKAQYFSAPFFIGRSIFYFALLLALAALVRRYSASKKIGALSAGGLIVYALCLEFASTDWIMSLTPAWHSTMFVVIVAAGQILGALALMTWLLSRLAFDHSLGRIISAKVWSDLGSLLLAFVIFWTYVSFSQFLIIWSGNLPREIVWYLQRDRGGWQWFAVALFVGQFLLPFFFLLSRETKRDRVRLGRIACGIFAASVLATFWLIAPAFHPGAFFVHWLDLAEWLALGGFWFALFLHFLKQQPLLPADFSEETPDA